MTEQAIPGRNASLGNLQQIIARLTEGVIIIEPSGTICWADDTALALHGAATLADLGGTVAGYASQFALTGRGGQPLRADDYPMHRLLEGEMIDRELVDVTRRSDGRHWVHEVRTLVLADGDEQSECFVVILDDETERFNAEERFERAFGANPAPAIIARLADMRFVKVNHGFLELTGYKRTALIGHSMHEIDVLRGAEKRALAVERLHAGETIPQMEGCLLLPNGRERTVLLGGQPLEIGDEACMLFTFADLNARQEAQDALRQSEQRFAKAFDMAPCPMTMLALDGLRILDVNAAFTAATGWRREEVIGRREEEIEMWRQGEPRDHLERKIRQAGRVHGVDIQLRSKNGVVRDFLLSAETVEIHGEHCLLSVMLDITERKQTETELLAAVQSAMQDTSWLSQKIVENLATINQAKGSGTTPTELAALPARAREVLGLMAQGLPDEAIASQLGIARNTLRNHIAAIYAKLGVHKRSAVVVWARERGLVALPKPSQPRTKQKVTDPD